MAHGIAPNADYTTKATKINTCQAAAYENVDKIVKSYSLTFSVKIVLEWFVLQATSRSPNYTWVFTHL